MWRGAQKVGQAWTQLWANVLRVSAAVDLLRSSEKPCAHADAKTGERPTRCRGRQSKMDAWTVCSNSSPVNIPPGTW